MDRAKPGRLGEIALEAQANPRTRAIPWVALSYLVIGLVALLPRVLDLGGFLTVDEASFWIRRSETFLKAIQRGDYGATALSTHPGVTTMWLGSGGILLRQALADAGLLLDDSFPTRLLFLRLPVVLAHTGGILLGYGLLRRLLDARVAALGALLWAADPFVIAYSRLLHVDGLLGTFATLSVLATCGYWCRAPYPAWLALSGLCAGLAILSKSPGLALPVVVGAIALAAFMFPIPETTRSFRRLAAPLAVWGAIVAVTIFALWPALWVGPLRAYEQLRVGIEVEGAQPHMLGNFFLGRPDPAPGPSFYPVALALRLTPWTLAGLLALPLALWPIARYATHGSRRAELRALAGLAWFAILLVVALSLFPKKFNRYIMPVFPALDILAAAGLVWAIAWLDQRLGKIARYVPVRAGAPLYAALGLAALLNAAFWHPYGIAAFNQALGGAQAGARTFQIGWGEGFERVAAWLNEQPDITGVRTVSPVVGPLQPYLRRGAQAVAPATEQLPDQAGYVVVYVRYAQGEVPFPPFDQFYGRAIPLHTVRIHGVEYAWIYQAPPPVPHPHPATFGSAIRLRGFEGEVTARPGAGIALRLFWGTSAPPPADYMLFAHLIGPEGRRYAQVDLPHQTSQWQPGRFITTEVPITVPADAPPGTYRLVIGFYELATGQRLPLTGAGPIDPNLDGPDALVLAEVDVH